VEECTVAVEADEHSEPVAQPLNAERADAPGGQRGVIETTVTFSADCREADWEKIGCIKDDRVDDRNAEI
jgi:hypothetical protein